MTDEIGGLPFVDEHRVRIGAARNVVWAALRRWVDSSLGVRAGNPLLRLLGTEPPTGFEVTHEIPNRQLTMAGHHRFSRYLLVFEVADDSGEATVLTAQTYAAFPGLHGRVYRALVIGTRGHAVAVGHMLRSVRRLSLRRVG